MCHVSALSCALCIHSVLLLFVFYYMCHSIIDFIFALYYLLGHAKRYSVEATRLAIIHTCCQKRVLEKTLVLAGGRATIGWRITDP